MLYYQICPTEMTNERMLPRIVHCVSQVTHQQYILTLVNQLADRKWTTKYTHVGVYTHYNHVVDMTLLHQVIGFFAISDRINLLYLDDVNLTKVHWIFFWIALGQTITSAVRIVNREFRFVFWV